MKQQKLVVTAAYFASFFAMGISMASLGPTLPALAERSGSSLAEIGILFTARSLGNLLGSVWSGQVYDRVSGNRLMALMVVGMALLTALTPLIPLFWVMTAILFLTGAVQGVLNIGGNALLVWLHGRTVRPFMSGLHFFFGIGTFLTPVLVAQWITRTNGLEWVYLLLAVIILPTAVVAFLPSPSLPAAAYEHTAERTNPLVIWLLTLVFACNTGASLAYGGWIYTYVIEMKLAGQTEAAYMTSVFWGALTISRLITIPIAAHFRPQTILRASFFGALLSLLVMLLWPGSLLAVGITSAGIGVTLASIYPTAMSLAGEMMPLTGKITSQFAVGSSIGSMILPWLIGLFFETSGPPSMAIVLLVNMMIALVVLMLLAQTTAPRPIQSQA